MPFSLIAVDQQPWDEWRPGVKTRNWSAETDGAREVHIGEQLFEPGMGVTPHWHVYEEHLAILSGRMAFVADGETHELGAPSCVVIRARTEHSFTSIGDEPLHIMAAISSPIHETFFAAFPENEAIRQYEADYPDGARRRVKVDPVTCTAVTVAP